MLSQRALERRIKRYVLKAPQDFFVVAAPGFEAQLEQEIVGLDLELTGLTRYKGGLSFTAGLDAVYDCNLYLRTAHRVLLRVAEVLAQSYPMLFNQTKGLPWEHYLGFVPSFAIKVQSSKSRLNMQAGIARTVADAIRERLAPLGLRPELSSDAPIEIYVRFFQDRCTLSINTSGEHLHKRGYRQLTSPAPIRETLAAAVLLQLGWQDSDLIVDPFCGSGTFLIEAAWLSGQRASGLQRAFAFEAMPWLQKEKWQNIKKRAEALIRPPALSLQASDISLEALRLTRTHASKAAVAEYFVCQQADALQLDLVSMAKAYQKPLLVANLPYGERIKQGGDRAFYRALSTKLAGQARGWRVALITSHEDWLEDIGLSQRLFFHNGGQQVCLLWGDL